MARAPHLRQAPLPGTVAALRLPLQAVHHLRPARPYRLPGRGCRAAHAAPHVALHPALHRAVGLQPLRAGPGHGLRFGAAELRVRLSAVGPCPHGADLEGLRGLLRQDDAHRRRQEHEGLLLGHPAQARVRHDRDPRVRHAAHHRARRRAVGLRAVAGSVVPGRATLHAQRGRLPRLYLQPLPGLPLRHAGGVRRSGHRRAHAAARPHPADHRPHRAPRHGHRGLRRAAPCCAAKPRPARTTHAGCATASATNSCWAK